MFRLTSSLIGDRDFISLWQEKLLGSLIQLQHIANLGDLDSVDSKLFRLFNLVLRTCMKFCYLAL